jgi:hypothetical protein
MYFSIAHPPTPWSSQWSLSFWLSHQYPICIPHKTLGKNATYKLSIISTDYSMRMPTNKTNILAFKGNPVLE